MREPKVSPKGEREGTSESIYRIRLRATRLRRDKSAYGEERKLVAVLVGGEKKK
jgi:hypothetical protein